MFYREVFRRQMIQAASNHATLWSLSACSPTCPRAGQVGLDILAANPMALLLWPSGLFCLRNSRGSCLLTGGGHRTLGFFELYFCRLMWQIGRAHV